MKKKKEQITETSDKLTEALKAKDEAFDKLKEAETSLAETQALLDKFNKDKDLKE